MKRKSQKTKAGPVERDEILAEYDFAGSGPNRYAARYLAGSAVVVLEPDVAKAFPNAGEVNEALQALAGIIRKHQPRRTRIRTRP